MPKIQNRREQNDINTIMFERYKAMFESIHLTRSLIVTRRVSKLVSRSYTLVTNYSEVTHSVRDDLSLYLDYSPEDPLLNYEERILSVLPN